VNLLNPKAAIGINLSAHGLTVVECQIADFLPAGAAARI